MKKGLILAGIIVLLFSEAGRRDENREEVEIEDESIGFKFNSEKSGFYV